MKHVLALAALGLAITLTGCNKETATEATAPPAAPASQMAAMEMPADGKVAKGTGAVTSVSADSVTIDHAAIPEAGWPAMTMAFKASPDLAASVKAGDKVAFDLKLQGGGGEITAIQKQ